MKTIKFVIMIFIFIFIGIFNSFSFPPIFNGKELYEYDKTMTINGVDIYYSNFEKYNYYEVKFSEPVTFDSFTLENVHKDNKGPSITIYTRKNNIFKKIDIENYNMDFPKYIVKIVIIEKSWDDRYKIEGIKPM